MQSGLPSYTVPPATAKSPSGHPFGSHSPSADNPAATQPFSAGSQAPPTQPFSAGSQRGGAQPFSGGSQAPATQPFSTESQAPATQPFSAGSPPAASQPYGASTQAPPTQPFGVTSGHPYGHQAPSAEDAPHPYRNPYGVGGAAATSGPFGGFSSPGAQRTTTSEQYGSPVPQQRGDAPGFGSDGYPSPDATMPVPTGFPSPDSTMPVYNYGSIDSTMPVSTNPVETSGSLTGHILAQGWHDEATDRRRSNVKVAIAMLVVLGLLVTVSLVFLLTAGDAFTNMVKGVFK
jgi:hypothetical protein